MRRLILGCVLAICVVSNVYALAAAPGATPSYFETADQLRIVQAQNIVVLEVKGKKYYVKDLPKLLETNICIHRATKGDIQTLYTRLYNACEQELSRAGAINNVYRGRIMISTSVEAKLAICLLNRETLRNKKQSVPPKSHVTLNMDIDTCVKHVNVLKQTAGVCPATVSVPDARLLDNLRNLNATYRGKTFDFNATYQKHSGLIGLFNGYLLLICENGKPVHIVRPSFSGAETCQGNVYTSVPMMGSLPSGAYLVRYADLQMMTGKDIMSWGKYRIPLRPALQNTSDRGSFYLHGNNDPNKFSSGGCLSMGMNITQFVEKFFKPKMKDLIVIVNLVPRVDPQLLKIK